MGTLDIRRIELRMAGIVLGERDYLIARGPRDVSNRQPVVNESLRYLDFLSIVTCAHLLDDDLPTLKTRQDGFFLLLGEGIEIKKMLWVSKFASHADFG